MNRFRYALLACVVGLWAFGARASEGDSGVRVYEGSVGAAPIVMSLEIQEDGASGSYFYRGRWFDIDLLGEIKGRVLTLRASATGDELTLEPNGDGYAGTLTTAKKKNFPVQLRAASADAAKDAPEGMDELGLYERIRLAGLSLKPDRVETVSGKALRWYVEPTSGFRLFRLEVGYAATAMIAMNKALTKIHWRHVSDYFGCLGYEGAAGSNLSIEKKYFSDAYVSFAVADGRDCAGRCIRTSMFLGSTFDARTGREMTLDDFLKFGRKVPQQDSDAWGAYRSEIFAPRLVALLKGLYPKEMKARKGECEYGTSAPWEFPSWHLTEKGLYVGAVFPSAPCDYPEWSIIPYSKLK